MYKRMLRSVLATAFVGALAYGGLGASDITWGVAPRTASSHVEAAPVGDITWGSVAPGDAKGDITWGFTSTSAGV
ncbi:hypothetical protein E6R60_12690 [Streptomyces sp. A0642]|nr:hypothetical protein E6R60_12690 [Streptomyces sp. A0642]